MQVLETSGASLISGLRLASHYLLVKSLLDYDELKTKSTWLKLGSAFVQGVPTLSDKSNFDVMARKFGQISKVKVFSCSQMKNNLF